MLGVVWAGDAAPSAAHPKPLAGARIVVSGNGATFTAVSDAEGVYQLAGVPPGSYELRASYRGRRTNSDYIQVTVAECCAFQDLTLWIDGHVGGVVQTDRGEPVAGLRIELAYKWFEAPSVRMLFRDATTTLDGRFLFEGIPPGEYLVGFGLLASPTPRQPYPETFRTVSLTPEQQITGLTLKTPQPLPARRVVIRVLMPDGGSASGARILVSDDAGQTVPIEVRADESGAAVFNWVQDAAFRILAESQDARRGRRATEWKRIKAGQVPVELTLRLSES